MLWIEQPPFCPTPEDGYAESCHCGSKSLSPLFCQGPQKFQGASQQHLGVRRQEETQLPQAPRREAAQVWKCEVESLSFLTCGKLPVASEDLVTLQFGSARIHELPSLFVVGLHDSVSLTSAQT